MTEIQVSTYDAAGGLQQTRRWVNGVEFEYAGNLLFAATATGLGCMTLGVPRGGRLEIGAE